MGEIQKRADDKAWDKKQDSYISDLNRKIEGGLGGDTLAALHGLHIPAGDEPLYDVDEMSDVDEQETLSDKIIRRLLQIGDAISENRDLPNDVKQRWTAILQECYPSEPKSVIQLHDLRQEIDGWKEIDPQSTLSLEHSAVGAVATMIEIYIRRFCS
jgi:hypothetical protein